MNQFFNFFSPNCLPKIAVFPGKFSCSSLITTNSKTVFFRKSNTFLVCIQLMLNSGSMHQFEKKIHPLTEICRVSGKIQFLKPYQLYHINTFPKKCVFRLFSAEFLAVGGGINLQKKFFSIF